MDTRAAIGFGHYTGPPSPAAMTSDSELIARIHAGDERAFTDLFHRHYRALRIYAARVHGSAGTSEEIVQQVFYRIWVNRERLEITGSVSAYLYTAVRNYALNQRDRARSEQHWRLRRSGELSREPVHADLPDEEVIAAELAAALDRAVAELPARCRQAFVLRRQHHLSYAEIARIMEITPKTVEIQIGNALKSLRRALAEWL